MEVYFGWVGVERHFYGWLAVGGGVFWMGGGGRSFL